MTVFVVAELKLRTRSEAAVEELENVVNQRLAK